MIQSNYGASFGLWFPGIEVVAVILWLVLFCFWYRYKWWGLLLILLGGGLNLIERLSQGYVTDYWRIPLTGIYNNFNDWLIFAGVVFIGIEMVWREKSK